MSSLTDPSLMRRQYAGASNLNARIRLHTLYSTNKYGWQRWVFDHLTLPPAARVLEIGCGPAELWRENATRIPTGWDITLADCSVGMLAAARRALDERRARFRLAAADVQALPFTGGVFDAVIANHMLYHVPNRPAALAEIERVLRPGGRLYAATNGQYHLYELRRDQIARRFGVDVGGPNPFGAAGFTLENGGDQLADRFTNVSVSFYEDSLEVTEPGPLLDYVMSMRELDEEQLAALRRGFEGEIAAQGALRITKSSGLFVAARQV